MCVSTSALLVAYGLLGLAVAFQLMRHHKFLRQWTSFRFDLYKRSAYIPGGYKWYWLLQAWAAGAFALIYFTSHLTQLCL